MSSPRCPECDAVCSPKGLAIHIGMKHRPRKVVRIDTEVLWRVLEGIGAIESGTWVSFQREDARYIADEYAREMAR